MKKNTSSFIQKVTLLAGSVMLLGTFFSACQTEEPQAQKVNVEQIIITDVDGESTETSVEQGDFIGLSATVLPENATDKTIIWESSDETIATVSEEGLVTAVEPEEDEEETAAENTVTITATAQDGSEVYGEIEVKILPKTIHVESITIASQYDNSILKDEDTALTITVLPENAAVKTYKIKSSDESVLKITETDGTISAVGVAQGTAKILVVADDRYQNTHKSAEYEIEVLGEKVDIESVALSAANTVIEEGNVVFTGSTSALALTKTPANATLSRTNGTVWSITEGQDLATLDENGNITFGDKAGSVTVKVVATDRSDKKAEATLTYEVRKPVTAVAITTPEEAALDEETVLLAREDDDETEADDRVITLGATVTPEDATIKTLTWTSSDETIATVDQTGKVTALKAGEATISAIAIDGSTKSASQTVRVFIPVTGIAVTADKTKSDVNTDITLTVTVEPSDAKADASFEITEGLGTVSKEGIVTLGATSGDVTIKVTSLYNTKKTDTITLHAMPDKTELKADIAKAEVTVARSVYSTEAKATFQSAIDAAKEEVADENDNEEDVANAIKALADAKTVLLDTGIAKWDVEILRRTNDQSTVTILWSDDTYALTTSNLIAEGNAFTAFNITTTKDENDTTVVSHNWWPNAPVANEKSFVCQPAFGEPSLENGDHVLHASLRAGDDEYDVAVSFTLNGETNSDETSASIKDVQLNLVDKRIKARARIQKEIDSATFTADNAKPSKFEEGAIEEFKNAIKTVSDALALLAGDDATLEAINALAAELQTAEEEFYAKKVIAQWDVEILRRTDDQTTVTVKWVDDKWKLFAQREGDVITSSFVHEEGAAAYTAFVIDETVSHVFWPDAAADFVTGDKYVSVKPAFHEPALHNGNHTLMFTVLADDGNEYDVTVTFALAGATDTDEAQAIVDDVVIKKADKTAKLKAKFEKEIAAAQTLHDTSNAEEFTEGALEILAQAITEAETVLESAATEEEVTNGREALATAVATFHTSEKIANWKFEYRQHDGDQYRLTVSWASPEWAIDLNSVSNGNATFVTDGKASHTYWPADQNKVESNAVIFNPANNQVAGNDALGEHTLVFDLKPLESDTIYDITINYRLDALNSDVTIISSSVVERETSE